MTDIGEPDANGWYPAVGSEVPYETLCDLWVREGDSHYRMTDCMFFDGAWQYRQIPFDEWEPIGGEFHRVVIAWRHRPPAPVGSGK